jgi:Domain of unknown function (DUF4399)
MSRRKWRWLMGFALVATVWVASGCGGDDEADNGAEGTPAGDTAAAEEFTVSITTLENESTVDVGDIEVGVDVGDFKITDKLGEDPVPGEGHVHYYLDSGIVPTAPGKPAVTEENTYHAEATTSYTWQGVRPGTHTFVVQLVNNDHTPLEPPATDQVVVTVE